MKTPNISASKLVYCSPGFKSRRGRGLISTVTETVTVGSSASHGQNFVCCSRTVAYGHERAHGLAIISNFRDART